MCQHANNAQSNNAPLSLKKKVCFGETQERFLAPFPCDFKNDLYYSPKELKAFKTLRDSDARSTSQGEGTSNCVRGLQHSLDWAEWHWHTRQHVKAVLEVHREQAEYGLRDEYEIFIVASANSKKDRIKARRMGAQDALDASELDDPSTSSFSIICSLAPIASSTACLAPEANTKSRRRSWPEIRPKIRRRSFTQLFSSGVSKLRTSSKNLTREVSSKSLSFRR